MPRYTMPDAPEHDDKIILRRLPDGRIGIVMVDLHGGVEQRINLSTHNAWALFVMLSLMLDLPLPKAVGNAIKRVKPGTDKWTLAIR